MILKGEKSMSKTTKVIIGLIFGGGIIAGVATIPLQLNLISEVFGEAAKNAFVSYYYVYPAAIVGTVVGAGATLVGVAKLTKKIYTKRYNEKDFRDTQKRRLLSYHEKMEQTKAAYKISETYETYMAYANAARDRNNVIDEAKEDEARFKRFVKKEKLDKSILEKEDYKNEYFEKMHIKKFNDLFKAPTQAPETIFGHNTEDEEETEGQTQNSERKNNAEKFADEGKSL